MNIKWQFLNNILLWLAIIILFLMGIKADTRSVERDSKTLDYIHEIVIIQHGILEMINP